MPDSFGPTGFHPSIARTSGNMFAAAQLAVTVELARAVAESKELKLETRRG